LSNNLNVDDAVVRRRHVRGERTIVSASSKKLVRFTFTSGRRDAGLSG